MLFIELIDPWIFPCYSVVDIKIKTISVPDKADKLYLYIKIVNVF